MGLADFAGSNSNGWPTGPVSIVDFVGSKFQRMASWPSFDFFIETGPVGHPLEFESAKSANPTTVDYSRKLTNSSLREQGTFFNVPGRKNLSKC